MNGKLNLNLPSPLQRIEHPLFNDKKVQVYFKRDDLIHPMISGNKWRKLKYNIHEAGTKAILTFGGAFSNHLAATAASCNYVDKKSIGVIRGEKILPLNPTLSFATEQGMTLEFISRNDYKKKNSSHYLATLKEKYKDPFIVPEGGSNHYGIKGCQEILDEIDMPFDFIISAVGTGATLAGIASGLNKDQKAIGISVLKGAFSLKNEIHQLLSLDRNLNADEIMQTLELFHDYHFGGYAKINRELVEFMRSFYRSEAIKTDPVYSAKSLYALFDLLTKDYFPKNSTIIYYHCGGLQGLEGIENRFDIKIYS